MIIEQPDTQTEGAIYTQFGVFGLPQTRLGEYKTGNYFWTTDNLQDIHWHANDFSE